MGQGGTMGQDKVWMMGRDEAGVRQCKMMDET